MDLDLINFNPERDSRSVRIDGFNGSVAYVVDSELMLQKLDTEGLLQLFDNSKGVLTDGVLSSGVVQHDSVVSVAGNSYNGHVYNGQCATSPDELVAVNQHDFTRYIDDTTEELPDGTAVYASHLFDNTRFLLNQQNGAAYEIGVFSESTSAEVSNKTHKYPTGINATFGTFIQPPRKETLSLDLLAMDIKAHLLMLDAFRSSIDQQRPAHSATVLTPQGQLFRNPDTGHWSYQLSPDSIILPTVDVRKMQPTPDSKDTAEAEFRIRSVVEAKPRPNFDDIGGLYDQLAKLRGVVRGFTNPETQSKWGVKTSRGIMLYGPPGVGKNMIVEALANESGAELRQYDSSDVNKKWFGESENTVSSIFDELEKVSVPTIVFFDEIDAVFQEVSNPSDGASGARNAIVGLFKTRIPRLLQGNPNLIVAAATNHVDRVPDAFSMQIVLV